MKNNQNKFWCVNSADKFTMSFRNVVPAADAQSAVRTAVSNGMFKNAKASDLKAVELDGGTLERYKNSYEYKYVEFCDLFDIKDEKLRNSAYRGTLSTGLIRHLVDVAKKNAAKAK